MDRKVSGWTTNNGSQRLRSLLTNLVQRDEEKRLNFVQLKAHPFFTGLPSGVEHIAEDGPHHNRILNPVPDPNPDLSCSPGFSGP